MWICANEKTQRNASKQHLKHVISTQRAEKKPREGYNQNLILIETVLLGFWLCVCDFRFLHCLE